MLFFGPKKAIDKSNSGHPTRFDFWHTTPPLYLLRCKHMTPGTTQSKRQGTYNDQRLLPSPRLSLLKQCQGKRTAGSTSRTDPSNASQDRPPRTALVQAIIEAKISPKKAIYSSKGVNVQVNKHPLFHNRNRGIACLSKLWNAR